MEKALLDKVDEIRRLEPTERAEALLTYSPQEAQAIFEQLEPHLQRELIEWLPTDKIDRLLADLEPDDRVRFLESLPESDIASSLTRLSPREWRLTQKLLAYPEESAGRIMNPEYLPLPPSLTAQQALELINRGGQTAGTLHALPVVDDRRCLIGLITLDRLIVAAPEKLVSELMMDDVPTVAPETDQEKVARVIQAADLLALPVVDNERRLLGLVTIDDAIDVIDLERGEDISRLGASHPLDRPYFSMNISDLTRSRLMWLLLLAVAGTLTVQVLQMFEEELEQVIALSLFIPLLIGVGGNSGAQSATTITRALATGDVAKRPKAFISVIAREAAVGLMLGSALGLLSYPVVILLFNKTIAATVSLTLVTICVLATLVGSGMPLIAKHLNIDPAVVSAPMVTTIVDATGLLLYFLIAKLIMNI